MLAGPPAGVDTQHMPPAPPPPHLIIEESLPASHLDTQLDDLPLNDEQFAAIFRDMPPGVEESQCPAPPPSTQPAVQYVDYKVPTEMPPARPHIEDDDNTDTEGDEEEEEFGGELPPEVRQVMDTVRTEGRYKQNRILHCQEPTQRRLDFE
jgi:hypothetical protein